MLTCSRCYRTLPASEFSPNRRRASGHQSACKECVNAAKREKYHHNSRRMNAQNKMYRDRDRVELAWYREHFPRPNKPWLDDRPDLWEAQLNE